MQQLDGNDSINSDSSSHNSSLGYNTDDEVDPVLDPVVLAPVPNQVLDHGQPIQLEVVEDPDLQPSPLPLCMMHNARSLKICKWYDLVAPNYTKDHRRLP